MLTATLLLSALSVNAQQGRLKHFGKLTRPEKYWVLTHPFRASAAYAISREAEVVARKMEPLLGSDYQGGAIDAFRHAYWMARLAQQLPGRAVIKLGEAHEKGNYLMFLKGELEDGAVADSVSGLMDNWNNRTGMSLGIAHPGAGRDSLIILIVDALREGRLRMINKDSDGNYLNAEGEIIPAVLLGRWNSPKLLIPSVINKNGR